MAFSARIVPLGLLLGLGLAACGGGDNTEPTATASAESPNEPANGELLVAFVANPDQPGVEPDAIRVANLTTGENRDLGEVALYEDIAFSPDGGLLAAVLATDSGSVVRLYNVESGVIVPGELEVAELAGLRWSPNGSFVAVVAGDSVTFVSRAGETRVHEGVGAPAGTNPLQWTWSADGMLFALVTAEGLVLLPLDESEGVNLPREEFPDPEATWVVRTGEAPREIGLVNLAPVSGLPEGRAEFPVVVEAGELVAGEPRIVSIYDWGTLPSQAFDGATAQQFPAVRKTCDPCRTADGSSSVLLFWLAPPGQPTPGPDVEQWPAGTGTFLALESTTESAIAVDLGIEPSGTIAIEAWRPIYDAVRIE